MLRTASLLLAASSVAAITLMACSSDDASLPSTDGGAADVAAPADGGTPPSDDGGSDASSTSDTGAGDDAAPLGDAASDAATDGGSDGGPSKKQGSVEILLANGKFIGAADFAAHDNGGCTVTGEGACTVTLCPNGAQPSTSGATNAGAIQLSGAGVPAGATIPVAASGSYDQYTTAAGALPAGTVITAKAAGGPLPAFTASIAIPASASVTSPDMTASSVTVSRNAPLNVAWTGGGDGKVSLGLLSSDATGASSARVECSFDAASGSATIPQATMSHLLSGGTGTIDSSTVKFATFSVADYASVIAAATGLRAAQLTVN